MPTLPTNPHYVGDSGHVNDHNTIVTALAAGAYISGTNLTNQAGTAFPTGKVLQVVAGSYATAKSTSTNTYIDTGLSVTITPKYNTSKILVMVMQNGVRKDTGNTWCALRLLKDSTVLSVFEPEAAYSASTALMLIGTCGTLYLDSPATTSATTYKTQFMSGANIASAVVQAGNASSTMVLVEIGA